MAWKTHTESGSAVRTIREWDFMKSREREGGGIEIVYGDRNQKHGHYGEDANGVTDTRSRPPVDLPPSEKGS